MRKKLAKNGKGISQKIVDQIFPPKDDAWKREAHIFAWKKMSDTQYLLVLADTGSGDKTPLGAISINAQALAATVSDNRHIRNILVESERMSRLIERLLTLSKLDEKTDVPKTAFSLSSCAEEMALTYESVAYDKGISYNYEIAEQISLYGSEDDLRQLMAIFIDNAIKHTEPDGVIHISLSGQHFPVCGEYRKGHCTGGSAAYL